MSWLEVAIPVRMRRVALVAPAGALRDVLMRVAETGTVEIGPPDGLEDDAGQDNAEAQAPTGLTGQGGTFEAQLAGYAARAVQRSGAAALSGWVPASRLTDVAGALAEAGGTVVTLRNPPGVQPPTLVGGPPLRRSVAPLVQTYGTVPYADIDPVWLAWAGYVLMFGMMFGDVGEGVFLIAVAVALRAGWPRWARRFRRAWPFVGGAGLMATVFGLLYGDCFGPNGLVPAVWLDPLDRPNTLLAVAAGVGAVLLAGAYALGTVNRWREGGWPSMLYAPSGVAGTGLFLGVGVAAAGWFTHDRVLVAVGGVVALLGLVLAAVGFTAEASGGGAGVIQVVIELFDLVVRLGSNVISFTRLAAFGLTHAALGLVVWEGTRALWRHGGLSAAGAASVAGAVVVFAVGTALAFSLEALVAAIQALRLEYYELFSRVFTGRGRPFRPWQVPATGEEGAAEEPAMKEAA
jgi:V/A-type H+/Na+-transporting ATPase subunit I